MRSIKDFFEFVEKEQIPLETALCFSRRDRDLIPLEVQELSYQSGFYLDAHGKNVQGAFLMMEREGGFSTQTVEEEVLDWSGLPSAGRQPKVGDRVFFHPVGDPTARKREAEVLPATVVRVIPQEGKRPLLNLKVHTDSPKDLHRTSVPHQDSRLPGMSFYSLYLGETKAEKGEEAAASEK